MRQLPRQALRTRDLRETLARGGSGLNLRTLGARVALTAAALWLSGCRCGGEKQTPEGKAAPSASGISSPSRSAPLTEPPPPGPTPRIGNAIARAADGRSLFVALLDESALAIVPMPIGSRAPTRVLLPGRPAQIVTVGARVFVTVRDPSLLWIGSLERDDIHEAQRIELPGDAWGLLLRADDREAYVSSAWSSQVSAVDLNEGRVRWSVHVAREPRGLALAANGQQLYVSHLVGRELTRLTLRDGAPVVARVDLPPSPLRTPSKEGLSASLGYSLIPSPDGARLFAARHALGALGKNAWFGAATVDVLMTETERPLAPARLPKQPGQRSELARDLLSGSDTELPGVSLTPFAQPRAAVYREGTDTLLVAGEGDDRIAELDALALDPSMAVIRHYQVGATYHPAIHVARECAAPSGLVLSADESRLWVYCRATNDIAEIHLASADTDPAADPVIARTSLGEDPLGPGGATGRKLFYNSTDTITSGGLGCAGCHPEGRDDGNVWHEATFLTEDGETTNFTGSAANIPATARTRGVPRRTPMLAGRVAAKGPYGWHAESETLPEREMAGFGLHRWGAIPSEDAEQRRIRARALADYLRRGLHPPGNSDMPEDEAIRRGREIFLSKEAECGECHVPTTGYTTRQAYPLRSLPVQSGFDEEENQRFKIPSLLFVGGRPPYFHDGSAPSLEALIDGNRDRMGKTEHLSKADRAALAAFLRTL